MENKVGFYAGRINNDDNIEECCFSGDKADFILLGTFDSKNEFVGRVITNWIDKTPTDSLLFKGQSYWDLGGIAENENGINLWDEVLKEFPNLLSKIESLYEFLEVDSDDEHFNLSKEIPDEIRLFCLFEGKIVNLANVKKGNGENLRLELFL
jgi:hypothetical protein